MSAGYTIVSSADKNVDSLTDVGICFYPNRKLREGRSRAHRLNLFLIGAPGVGKSTLINTIFSTPFMATQRRRESSFFEVATHRGTRREGNIDLDVEVVEVLGYGSERLANEAYYSKIIDTVRDRHRESHQKETATPRCIETAYDGLFQVALYLIPPTFSQFSPKEIALFRDLSRMTIVVPIISRADMYTASELNDKKLLVRAQFEANRLIMVPDLLRDVPDNWLAKDFTDITARWPLALMGSNQVHEMNGELIRARVYPWGVVDIDNPEFSDMLALEKLLVSSLFISCQEYVRNELYEKIWRPWLMVSSTEQPTGNPVMAVPRNYSTKSSQQSLPELAQIQTTTIKMSCDDLSKVSQLQSTSGTSIFDEYSEDKIEKSSVSVSDRRSFFESQRASISNC